MTRRGIPVKVWLALPSILLIVCSPTTASVPRGEGPHVLFVGNSLTYWNDMPGILQGFFNERGIDGYVASVAFPNFALEDHLQQGAALDSIRRGGWDVVVLQQGPSATEGRIPLLVFSEQLADSIRLVAAVPGLYMVWPPAIRSFEFDAVARSYTAAAASVDGMLFPVGKAWQLVWRRDPTVQLYGPDSFHPTEPASYLAAVVIFERLTGQDPLGLPSEVERIEEGRLRIDPAVATLLQEAGREANRLFGR